MSIQFGDIEVVKQTFSREPGAVREQAYNGMKFRRWISEKDNETKEVFSVSNKVWDDLNLDVLALTHAKIDGRILLLVLEDKDDLEPPAKFCKRKFSKEDGTPLKKGQTFGNPFLMSDLQEVGIIEAESIKKNQFLSLTNITSEITGMPTHIKAVYQLSKDTTVDETAAAEAEKEEEKAEAEVETSEEF